MQRYQVMWKRNGKVEPLSFTSGRFFFRKRAFSYMHFLNVIGHYCWAKTPAVVWDHKLNKQISTTLYLGE